MPVSNPLGGGTELAYAQITADVTAITSTTYVDVAGLALTSLVQGVRPVMVTFHSAQMLNGTANQSVIVGITSSDGATVYTEGGPFLGVAFGGVPVTLSRRFAVGALPAGLKIRVKVSGGSAKIGAGSPGGPAFLQVVEI